jgi:hypothetical protein
MGAGTPAIDNACAAFCAVAARAAAVGGVGEVGTHEGTGKQNCRGKVFPHVSSNRVTAWDHHNMTEAFRLGRSEAKFAETFLPEAIVAIMTPGRHGHGLQQEKPSHRRFLSSHPASRLASSARCQ